MARFSLDALLGQSLEIDVCAGCRAFWFDPFETLHLTPASTLEVFRRIAEAEKDCAALPIPPVMHCPKCANRLKLSHDRQRNTPFQYFSCHHGHGRFQRFSDFLKEKNFIQPLSADEIAELRRKVRMIHCSNCAAPIDLVKESTCSHCGAPLVMLDPNAMNELARQFQKSAEPKPLLAVPPPIFHDDIGPELIDFDSVLTWVVRLLGAR